MALNFLGLGFSFGAKDLGLEKLQDKISKGFSRLTDAMGGLGSKVMAPFDTLGQKLEHLADPLDRFKRKIGEQFRHVGDALKPAFNKFDTLKAKLADLAKKGLSTLGVPFIAIAKRFKSKGAGEVEGGGKKIVEILKKMKDSMQVFNDVLKQNRLQTFIQSVALDKLNAIAEHIHGIATQGGELTTSLEAQGAQMAKTARAAAVNMGLMGKDAVQFTSKVSGMALGLNIDVNAAADATYAWQHSMESLRAVGIKSAEDLAKLSEVTGVNAKEFGKSMEKMRKQFHFADKDISQVVSSFVSFGQATGNVGGALADLPGMMDLLSRHAASMGKAMKPDQLADFAAQTAAVAAGLGKMGHSQEQAKEIAMKLADTLVGEQENMQNMFSGTSDELGAFTENLAISTGDVQDAFSLMRKGPQGLVTGIAKMVIAAKKSGKNVSQSMGFLAGRLRGVLGEQMTADLVNMFSNADDAMLKTMADTRHATKDLGQIAKEGFSTGRTLQEAYDMAKDSAIASFRALGHAREHFVADSQKEFGKLTQTLQGLVKKGGPMGKLVEKMADIDAIGAKALLPQTLRPMAAVFGTIVERATPMIGALGAMGFRFKHLVSPIGLATMAITALGARFADLRLKGKTTQQAIDQIGEDIRGLFKKVPALVKQGVTALKGIFKTVAAEAKKVDWQGIWKQVSAKAKEGMAILKRVAKDFLHGLISGIDPKSKEGASTAAKIGDALHSIIKTAFKFVKDKLVEYFKGWWHDLTGLWSDPSKSFKEKVAGTFESSAGLITGAFALAKFTPIFGVITKLGGVIETLWPVLETVAGALFSVEGAIVAVIAAVAALTVGFMAWPKETKNVVDKIKGFLHDGAHDIMKFLTKAVVDGIKWLFDQGPKLITEWLPKLSIAVYDAMQSLLDIILSIPKGIVDGVLDALGEAFPQFKDFFDALKKGFDTFYDTLSTVLGVLMNPLGAILKYWQDIKDWIDNVTKSVNDAGDAGDTTFGKIVAAVRPVIKFLIKVNDFVGKVIVKSLEVLWNIAKFVFEAICVVIKPIWAALETIGYIIYRIVKIFVKILWGTIKWVVGMIADTISWLWTNIFEPVWTTIMNYVMDVWTKYIKPIWDPVAKFFGDLFDKVWGYIKDASDKVTKAWKDVKDFFAGFFDWIEDKVDKLFGHSTIPEMFKQGFDKIKGIVTGVFDFFNTIFEKITDIVGNAISGGFIKAFKKASESIGIMIKDWEVQFVKLSDFLHKLFNKLFNDLIDMTSVAAQAIQDQVADVAKQLASVVVAFENLAAKRTAAAQAAAEAAKGTEGTTPNPNQPPPTPGLVNSSEVDAINYPKWWTDTDGYKAMFTAHLNVQQSIINAIQQLANAISATGGVGRGGGAATGAGAKARINAIGNSGTGVKITP
jgi:phage-related protein